MPWHHFRPSHGSRGPLCVGSRKSKHLARVIAETYIVLPMPGPGLTPLLFLGLSPPFLQRAHSRGGLGFGSAPQTSVQYRLEMLSLGLRFSSP